MKEQSGYAIELGDVPTFKVLYSADPSEKFGQHRIFIGEIYPNPGENAFTVPFNLPESKTSYQLMISVYDLSGKVLKTVQHEVRYTTAQIAIDLKEVRGHGILPVSIEIKNGEYHSERKFNWIRGR
jgi:hypothetical protein